MDDTRTRNRAGGAPRLRRGVALRRALAFAWCVLAVLPPGWESAAHAQQPFQSAIPDRPSFENPDLDNNPGYDDGSMQPPKKKTDKKDAPRYLNDDDPATAEERGHAGRRDKDDTLDLRFAGTGDPIVEVRIEGNETIPAASIEQHIRTRTDRPADEKQVREDVRALYATRWFYSVEPRFVKEDKGLVLVFAVLERPIVRRVEYAGRKQIKENKLAAETGLKVGSPFDVSANREAARRLEQYYHEKGYAFATVELDKGGNGGDREVVFRIYEGPKVHVTSVKFEGNKDFSDSLLATKLQTKKAILWLIGGKYDPATIPDDITALKQYYHSLGYFDVKLDHRVGFSDDKKRAHIEYFIEEGTRYRVRDVQFNGNQIFATTELKKDLKLTSGKFFNSRFLDKDLDNIKGRYGETGRLFARVEAEPRFLSTPGEADLVYKIDEDKPYRIGRVNVHFNKGDDSHTKRSVALNYMKIKSGDLADPRKIEKSKKMLGGVQVFENGPADGPKIRISKRDSDEEVEDHMLRGQSDDSDDLVGYLRSTRLTPTSGWTPFDSDDRGRLWRNTPRAFTEDEAPPPVAKPVTPRPTQTPSAYVPPRVVATVAEASPNPVPDSNLTPAVRATQPTRGDAPVAPAPVRRVPRPEPQVSQPAASKPEAAQAAAIQKPVGNNNGLRPMPRAGEVRTVARAVSQPAPEMPFDDDASSPTWNSVEPRSAFVDGEPNCFVFRAQNAFDGPIPVPGNPIIENSPQGDPFNDRLPRPQPDIVDLDVDLVEARTGRLMFGVGVNSDAGLVGSIVLTEQNFDIARPPTSFRDIIDGTAWRGAGQKFRLEAVPGNQVSRYMASWNDPYIFDTDYNLGLSGFYYNRFFTDWTEQRSGGRISLGRQLTPQLSITGALRLEDVNLSHPTVPTPPILAEALGAHLLSTFRLTLSHDTRDAPFLPGEGHYINGSVEQAFGTYNYPRAELEASQYFTVFARPDGGGRHILTLSSQLGWTDSGTPIFERFFAGGFQTFRGFAFRGVGPKEENVRIGGRWMAIGSVEYMFPVMASEMVRFVTFSDFGTVTDTVSLDDFRLTVGFGLRVTVPAMGPVPLAFDFGFPILKDPNDQVRIFSFYVGVQR